MMPPGPGFRDANILTRTTLQVDESLPTPSIAQLVHALQRVPGVLLAEIAAGSARAIVAHDAAVPSASLLAAAEGAGVHARIVAETRAPAPSAERVSPLEAAPTQRVLTIAAALFFGLVLGDALIPHLADNRLLLPIMLSSVSAFVIGRAMFKPKPK
jgi:hypothetical protein